MIEITSERLKAKIFEPGEGLTRGTRFDRTGFICGLELDGTYQFAHGAEAEIPEKPIGNGAGFCSEITSRETYDEAVVGEKFHKFGVGLLTKPEEDRYFFNHAYDCSPYETKFTVTENRAEFLTMPISCGGFSLQEKKTVELQENRMTVTYHFTNVGEKELTFTEYCHNFVTLDGLIAGPGTRLEFPTVQSQVGNDAREMRGGIGNLIGTEYGFTFGKVTEFASRVEIHDPCIDRNQPFSWRICSDHSRLSVKGETSFVPSYIVVFTRGASISPEVMNTVTLPVNGCSEYTRCLTFDVL